MVATVQASKKLGPEVLKLPNALSDAKIKYEDHTISVFSEKAQNQSVLMDGQSYTLQQLHFHTPSEHQINGKSYPMEIHFELKDRKGNLAVIGVVAEAGTEHQELAKFWAQLPTVITKEYASINKELNLSNLLPVKKNFFLYNGSLTTPPCTEGVTWVLLEHPIEISQEQLQVIKQVVKQNNRPVQPINNRLIYRYMTEG